MRRLAATCAALLLAGPAAAQGSKWVASEERPREVRGATELAGEPLVEYPHFQYVRAFHEGEEIHFAVDPSRHPTGIDRWCDVYVLAARSKAEWRQDRTLIDVRGVPQPVRFPGTSLTANTIKLGTPVLNGDAGTSLGVGYDLVLDFNRNGLLDLGDLIDGLGDEAGFYVLRDPSLPGPLDVTVVEYSGGYWLTQRTYYPTEIAGMGQLPLVVVSHGNGHNYQWYDHIGYHLASYGYVVMSHRNQTGPGIGTASTTTLTNTDYILAEQDTIEGGVLSGHLDGDRITWIGHSRGGEGIVRAYTRIQTGDFVPAQYSLDDIVLMSSMAPTIFLDSTQVDPQGTNYHLFFGGSDTDVTGGPGSRPVKPFAIYERSEGNRQATYIHGVGHAWFHDAGGDCFCAGPDLLDKSRTHEVVRGYYLALVKRYVEGNVPARDYFERTYVDFHPPSIDFDVRVAAEHRRALSEDHFYLDDFETQEDLHTSSSGGAVSYNVYNVVEARLEDNDGTFVFEPGSPMNGMTRTRPDDSSDDPRGVIFEWSPEGGESEYFYEWEVVPAARNFRQFKALSFRAAQATRHPETDALDAPLSFTVTLRDGLGRTSSIPFRVYGGITRTYEREGNNPEAGAGWGNEFNSVRLRLTDFTADGVPLDLGDVRAVRFQFGSIYGSVRGRIGVDDVQLIRGEEQQ